MDITPVIPKKSQLIESYGDNNFKISGIVYPHSIIITPDQVRKWQIDCIEALDSESFSFLFEKDAAIELLLVGCGSRFQPLSSSIRSLFRSKKINVDSMDTGAACRTYNILMAEGRRVAAALMTIE